MAYVAFSVSRQGAISENGGSSATAWMGALSLRHQPSLCRRYQRFGSY